MSLGFVLQKWQGEEGRRHVEAGRLVCWALKGELDSQENSPVGLIGDEEKETLLSTL